MVAGLRSVAQTQVVATGCLAAAAQFSVAGLEEKPSGAEEIVVSGPRAAVASHQAHQQQLLPLFAADSVVPCFVLQISLLGSRTFVDSLHSQRNLWPLLGLAVATVAATSAAAK